MSQSTSKLGLILPGGGSTGLNMPPDPVDIDVLNENFKKIDAYALAWGLPTEYSPVPETPQSYGPGASSVDMKTWKIGKTAFMAGTLNFASLMNYENLLTVRPAYRPVVPISAGMFAFGGTNNMVFGQLGISPDTGRLRVSSINTSPPATGSMNLNMFWRLD